ncbi:MAG: DNA mismatch repair endonuclease MutL [Verrucomicrobiales bacterium]|nr:DNA mismatch repair endonuclease MutL [Verrucomicrobiales bacterium]MCP5526470.1 DNA mismatch repair endonuclease MutL [Verrucomicrobiales bacterium]
MNRIRLLPEQVANQIAAGEVVERPASVVKELVENALDAGASRISVEVQAGGRSLIRITDDGMGMTRDDALLAFERHATSKIQRAEDLSAITSMGFRGEALPSIASVSRLTLTTREREGGVIEATQVVIHGGKMIDVRSASGPPGTSVEVRQLFYNLPARRKFLRSEETERSHIQHYVTLAALSSPQVGFTLTQNQRTVWQLPPAPGGEDAAGQQTALRERLRALHGSELNLIPVDHTEPLARPGGGRLDPGEEDDDPAPATSELRIRGFIGAPGVSRATREDQHLFVNRRPVENRGLNFALLEGYHTALMKGRYPVCCLFLEIDPALVDVNIHPAKREVKFRGERDVRRAVSQAVREALMAFANRAASAEQSAPSGTESPAGPTPVPATAGSLAGSTPPPAPADLALDLDDDPLGRLRPRVLLPSKAAPAPPRQPSAPTLPPSPPAEIGDPVAPPSVPAPVVPARPVGTASAPVPLLKVPLRLVGVIGRLYVVLESDRGLVLLDQHAAHERVLFEQMLNRLEQGPAPCQRLLLPQTIELSVRDADHLREALPALGRLGVGLSEFGERTFLLDGLPPFVRVRDARQFVLELLDGLKASGPSVNPLRLGEEMIAKTVCRHAVKANDPLQGPELEELVNDLRRCAMPYTCPHGRPTLIEFSYRELEKRFGRSA